MTKTTSTTAALRAVGAGGSPTFRLHSVCDVASGGDARRLLRSLRRKESMSSRVGCKGLQLHLLPLKIAGFAAVAAVPAAVAGDVGGGGDGGCVCRTDASRRRRDGEPWCRSCCAISAKWS